MKIRNLASLPLRHRAPHVGSGLTAILAATLLLSACSSTQSPVTSPNESAVAFQHIHKLEAGQAGGDLFVATHEGLYRLAIGSNSEATASGPIGGFDFDPMGFTIVGGIAYASGHPGPTTPSTFGTPNLGLITSKDLGKTWTNVSLTGQTDFHALTVMTGGGAEPGVFGIDSSKQRIQRSLDGGQTWGDGAALVARDLLAVGHRLYATTRDGLAVSDDNGASFAVDSIAPGLYLIAADQSGQLVGIDTSGKVWSKGADGVWTMGGAVSGTPQAIAVDGGRIYVADDRGIAFTEDRGRPGLCSPCESDRYSTARHER